jgi:hypothetical protein
MRDFSRSQLPVQPYHKRLGHCHPLSAYLLEISLVLIYFAVLLLSNNKAKTLHLITRKSSYIPNELEICYDAKNFYPYHPTTAQISC